MPPAVPSVRLDDEAAELERLTRELHEAVTIKAVELQATTLVELATRLLRRNRLLDDRRREVESELDAIHARTGALLSFMAGGPVSAPPVLAPSGPLLTQAEAKGLLELAIGGKDVPASDQDRALVASLGEILERLARREKLSFVGETLEQNNPVQLRDLLDIAVRQGDILVQLVRTGRLSLHDMHAPQTTAPSQSDPSARPDGTSSDHAARLSPDSADWPHRRPGAASPARSTPPLPSRTSGVDQENMSKPDSTRGTVPAEGDNARPGVDVIFQEFLREHVPRGPHGASIKRVAEAEYYGSHYRYIRPELEATRGQEDQCDEIPDSPRGLFRQIVPNEAASAASQLVDAFVEEYPGRIDRYRPPQ